MDRRVYGSETIENCVVKCANRSWWRTSRKGEGWKFGVLDLHKDLQLIERKRLQIHCKLLGDAARQDTVIATFNHKGYVRGAEYIPERSQVLSWSNDGFGVVWDATTNVIVAGSIQHKVRLRAANIPVIGRFKTSHLWARQNQQMC